MFAKVDLIAMTLDRRGHITFCNDYLLRLTGWTRDEVIGRSWFGSFLPASIAADIEQMFATTIESGTLPVHYQNPIKTRTGELREIVWHNTVLRDAAGDCIGTASIGEDVTDRARMEAELRESETHFRELAENIHEVFWVSEPEKNRIRYVSPAYEKIWGRPRETLYDAPRAWLAAIRPEDRARIQAAVATKQTEGTYDEEYRITRPDGTERWIRDRAFPIRGAEGALLRVIGVAEDITERKQLQEQFLRAQRMEAIGTLAGGVAHDLNNILAPVLMGAGLLKDRVLDPRDQELVGMIEAAATRGTGVIRQLLTFSRGIAGDRVSVQLRHLMGEMTGIMRETFPRDIAIEATTARDLRPVTGDPTQLHQVVMNLCVNARDAMPNGGRLRLDARNEELSAANVAAHAPAKPGPYVALNVTDTGEGIPPEILGRIFDPFFTTKPPTKGTGLGLSTALGIVRSHDGFITVTSTPRCGTTFTVFLPAACESGDRQAARDAAPPPQGRGELVLVVDDEEPMRRTTRLLLEQNGYRVLTAVDGAEAVAAFVGNRADVQLVLTDLMMPVMNGVNLIRVLQAMEPKIRVLATSGLNDQASQVQLAAAGVREVLPKPCDHRVLLEAIDVKIRASAGEESAAQRWEGDPDLQRGGRGEEQNSPRPLRSPCLMERNSG